MTAIEKKFLFTWLSIEGPKLLQEHKFDPSRRWRFDFAHIESKTAIEIEGGAWVGGRHNRASGFEKDCEKYFNATLRGWDYFRLTPSMIKVNIALEIAQFMKAKNEK